MSTPGQQDPLIGKVLADRFEILGRIGEGGTGVVYKAKQITVDRTVAIKVLGAHVSSDPQWVKRFHNEARAAARLDHPNTVRMIDFGETKEGLLFIAMEYLHGRPLSDEIARLGKIPPQRALRIISQVCQSLQEAHTQGIIHRDIKPDNVFLVEMKGSGDFVKVLDFSVAKMDTPDAQLTRAGTVFGTPAYMSPEQARGVKLAPQSDVYACGIVLYEMLTGKPPFEAALPMEVVMMHLRQKPAPLVGFPEPLVRVVMKALEKTPDRRQGGAEDLHRECVECLETLFPRQTPSAGMSAVTEGQRVSLQAPTVPPQQVPHLTPPAAATSFGSGPATVDGATADGSAADGATADGSADELGACATAAVRLAVWGVRRAPDRHRSRAAHDDRDSRAVHSATEQLRWWRLGRSQSNAGHGRQPRDHVCGGSSGWTDHLGTGLGTAAADSGRKAQAGRASAAEAAVLGQLGAAGRVIWLSAAHHLELANEVSSRR
jgi:predicted Ser/Thr protein kinase